MGGLGKREHPQGIPSLVGHLRFLQQDIALHRQITGFLCPFDRPVVPIARAGGVMEVAVEPTGELGAVSADLEQRPSYVGFDVGGVVVHGPQDAQRHRERLRRPQVAVIGLAIVELPAEVVDHRAIEVSMGVVQGSSNVL